MATDWEKACELFLQLQNLKGQIKGLTHEKKELQDEFDELMGGAAQRNGDGQLNFDDLATKLRGGADSVTLSSGDKSVTLPSRKISDEKAHSILDALDDDDPPPLVTKEEIEKAVGEFVTRVTGEEVDRAADRAQAAGIVAIKTEDGQTIATLEDGTEIAVDAEMLGVESSSEPNPEPASGPPPAPVVPEKPKGGNKKKKKDGKKGGKNG